MRVTSRNSSRKRGEMATWETKFWVFAQDATMFCVARAERQPENALPDNTIFESAAPESIWMPRSTAGVRASPMRTARISCASASDERSTSARMAANAGLTPRVMFSIIVRAAFSLTTFNLAANSTRTGGTAREGRSPRSPAGCPVPAASSGSAEVGSSSSVT